MYSVFLANPLCRQQSFLQWNSSVSHAVKWISPSVMAADMYVVHSCIALLLIISLPQTGSTQAVETGAFPFFSLLTKEPLGTCYRPWSWYSSLPCIVPSACMFPQLTQMQTSRPPEVGLCTCYNSFEIYIRLSAVIVSLIFTADIMRL